MHPANPVTLFGMGATRLKPAGMTIQEDCANRNPHRSVAYLNGKPIPPLLSIRDGLTIHCAASAVARHPRYVPMGTDPG
jgi:hypothetical protein